ncbi:MAG TPA: WYL domain-containing protein, partial [Saprospiraceae bacterium]|nr:WYL domain-containing protein [Saprospiraceae bacterium]
ELERVVFRAIQEQAFYINTKPIHHSQRVLSVAPESTTFAIDVIPNFELESILLSYGERIEVLEPESLRLQMKERYEQAARLYAECSE